MTKRVTLMMGDGSVYPGYAFEADTYDVVAPSYSLCPLDNTYLSKKFLKMMRGETK